MLSRFRVLQFGTDRTVSKEEDGVPISMNRFPFRAPCSTLCGGGMQARTRRVFPSPDKCELSEQEERPCNFEPCPKDCMVRRAQQDAYYMIMFSTDS